MSFYTPPRRSRRTLTITDLEILTTFDYWAHHKIHNLRMRRRDKIHILALGTPDATKHIGYTHALKHKIIAIAISGLIVHYDTINSTLRSSSPSIHTHTLQLLAILPSYQSFTPKAISNHLMHSPNTAIQLGCTQVPPRHLSPSTLLCLH